MSTDSRQFEVDVDSEPWPRSVLDRLLWPVFLLLAWLCFELTANATLSLVLACVKFGVNDFQTGVWLWRIDPQRPRGRACGMFYVSSGVWKIAIVPLLTAGTIALVWAIIAPRMMQRAQLVTEQLFLALQVGMWAAAILVVLVGCAATLSLTARWRVWVHPNLHASRQEEIWPPEFSVRLGNPANHAILIVLTAILTGILIGPVLTLITVEQLLPPGAIRPLVQVLIALGFPIFGMFALGIARGRLFAQTPWECWPESIRQLGQEEQLLIAERLAEHSSSPVEVVDVQTFA